MLADLDATMLTNEVLRANRKDPDLEIYRVKAREAGESPRAFSIV
jgi:hypothetical protein